MSTREQFGKYLLLKKLTEDALGETFRAGMLGTKGMERVVLLRVLNGQGIDGQRLWGSVQERSAIQKVLRSPNLGEGVEMGEIQGIPYIAYDYLSGKNLTDLLTQAAKKKSFIPTEHALLITERIALALALACEHRHEGQRLLHGFLVPHLVMISNEGETRLLGFEVAPGLRDFSANPVIRKHFGRYLAPEAMGGAPPHKADDIYSLGVILYELLTGAPLPPPAPDGYASIIDRAQLATEGTHLPAELAELLKHSLVARDQRIQDVVSWHKVLNKWMFEGQYNPTTFNLAFFMHNIFRQEIERESQEIEVEKTLPLPTVQPAGMSPAVTQPIPVIGKEAGDAAAATAPTAATAQAAAPPPAAAQAPAEEEKKGKGGLWALLAAILLLSLGAAAFYFWKQSQNQTPSQEEQIAAASQPAQALPAGTALPETEIPGEGELQEEEAPASPSPEEVQDKIDELIDQRASAMEAELKKRFDQQLQGLQGELDEAKKAAEERDILLAEKKDQEEKARLEAEAIAEAEAIKQAKAQEAEQKKKDEAAKLAAAEQAQTQDESAATTSDAPTQVAQSQPQQTAPQPPPPSVRRGDLVTPGAGVTPPRVVKRHQPRFPEMARRLGKKGGTVTVKVLVDETGKVRKTEAVNKLGFGFDSEAMMAAKNSTYSPATKDGVPVKMWLDVSVVFQKQ